MSVLLALVYVGVRIIGPTGILPEAVRRPSKEILLLVRP